MFAACAEHTLLRIDSRNPCTSMKTTSFVTATLLLSSFASAQILASDNFSYTGQLNANGWGSHSGTGFFVNANGSVATLQHGSGSREDVNLPFTALTATDVVFASFTMNVPSGNPVNPDAEGTYFVHFKDTGSAFRGRVGVLSPAAGGDFRLAVHADSANLGAGTAWPVELSFDTNYTVVFSWDAATGTSQLWLNPFNATAPSISHTGTVTGTLISQFALRQSNDHTGSVLIDDVVVGRSFNDAFCASPNSIPQLDTPDCSVATFSVTGSPLAGNQVNVTLTGASVPAIVLSTLNVDLPLLPLLACDCVLVPSPDITAFVSTLTLTVPATLPPSTRVFIQGGDLTSLPGAASPCDPGIGLFFGLTDAFCIVTG